MDASLGRPDGPMMDVCPPFTTDDDDHRRALLSQRDRSVALIEHHEIELERHRRVRDACDVGLETLNREAARPVHPQPQAGVIG